MPVMPIPYRMKSIAAPSRPDWTTGASGLAAAAAIAASDQPPQERLQALLENAMHAVGARRACIWLFDHRSDSYVIFVHAGLREDTAAGWKIQPPHGSPDGSVFEPESIANRSAAQAERISSVLAAPIFTRGKPLAAVSLFDLPEVPAAPERDAFIRCIAAIAAGIVGELSERKEIETAVARYDDQLTAVNALSAALLGGTDLSSVLPPALHTLLELLHADGALLFEHDADADTVNVACCIGMQPDGAQSLERRSNDAREDTFVRRTIEAGRTLVLDDVATSDLPEASRKLAMRQGINQLVSLPLRDQGRTIGVLQVFNRYRRPFTPTDHEMLKLAQAQFALAVGRARLFAEIRDQKNTLERVLAGTADGVYVVDAKGRFLLWNASAARITGVEAEEALAAGYDAIGAADRQGRSLAALDRMAYEAAASDAKNRQTSLNYEVFFDATSRWVAVSASPLRDPAGTVGAMVHAFRDVTAARELEQLKSDFISTVSHELRTPLTSIKGATALLVEHIGNDGGTTGELLDMVRNNSERLLRLINDLLDATKIEAGKLTIRKRACEPKPLLERATAGMTGYADEYGVTVRAEVASGLAPIVADPDRVEQILSNLLSNAVKFSHRGDEVVVRARADGPMLRVDVSDSGVGIAENDLPRLFEKFAQLEHGRRSVPGTGLGLAITKGLVEAHGGSISVSSRHGEGSTFTFTLPFAKRTDDH